MQDASQILIVDDETTSRELLGRALISAGFPCRQSDSALQALKIVRRDRPMVILLDYKMPEVNGLEMLKQLRSDADPKVAQIPVIMMTGSDENEILCLEAGADDFVTKPTNIAVLRARIETQLRLGSLRLQLQEQTEEAETRRIDLERDLDAARLTQQSLIPLALPAIRGWDMATCYQPVIQVGGDIYGWLRLKDDCHLFWIADAAGHGVAAALLTTLAKLLFHHASVEHETPVEIMRAVNNDFRGTFRGRSFMTAMAVALDPASGRASVCGAGHPPLLVTRLGRGTETIHSSAPPLGLAEQDLRETVIDLARGDAFILYTDGLLGEGKSGQPLRTPTQLAGALNPFTTGAQKLLSQLLNQAGPGGQKLESSDDVAVVVVQRETGA